MFVSLFLFEPRLTCLAQRRATPHGEWQGRGEKRKRRTLEAETESKPEGMDLEREIMLVLREAGDSGMPLRRISLNVFNMKNSFFQPLVPEEVHREVAEWLQQESKKSNSPVTKAETRGWYRLNPNSQQVQQLMLEFLADDEVGGGGC